MEYKALILKLVTCMVMLITVLSEFSLLTLLCVDISLLIYKPALLYAISNDKNTPYIMKSGAMATATNKKSCLSVMIYKKADSTL